MPYRQSVERKLDEPLALRSVPSPQPFKPLVATSAKMCVLLEKLARVANSRATVLIEGESGTGKEVCAQWVHAHSERSAKPFVGLNCAALPDNLLESELFGHEKGAFTGASHQRKGRFEQANGGTLFLDEIGAAAPAVQLRLLRVLQEREFERVGGERRVRVDVRIVAATNVDLQEEVRAGRFREDLLYRLHVVPVKLPSLRERVQDIPPLIEHFLYRANLRNDRMVQGVAESAIKKMCQYPWPGNVRELENVIERMVVLSTRTDLCEDDLPTEIAEWQRERETVVNEEDFKSARFVFERRFLCEALKRHDGVIAQVAESIGMSRKNLYIKLECLGISYDDFRKKR
jgi:DNA-binding NtrC family response regulator